MTGPLTGRVVALIGAGTEADRALVVACAEAGAGIALGTVDASQPCEFAMHSIANEIWAIGREHFVRVMESAEPTAVAAFAEEVWDSFGRCDVLLLAHARGSNVAPYELSLSEWSDSLRANLTGPFLAFQAFARLMERQQSGLILFAPADLPGSDLSVAAARGGQRALAEAAHTALWPFGVSVTFAPGLSPAELVALLT